MLFRHNTLFVATLYSLRPLSTSIINIAKEDCDYSLHPMAGYSLFCYDEFRCIKDATKRQKQCKTSKTCYRNAL